VFIILLRLGRISLVRRVGRWDGMGRVKSKEFWGKENGMAFRGVLGIT
jgi:hypothetical protein